VEGCTVGQAATRSGWSARMLRYLEHAGLVVPARTPSGYRLYGIRELNQLRTLRDLRRRFAVELTELAFAARLRRDPDLRAAVDTWLAGTGVEALDWEQRKHERLLGGAPRVSGKSAHADSPRATTPEGGRAAAAA
jgi:DNA-binding transcriptional MerR regulator